MQPSALVPPTNYNVDRLVMARVPEQLKGDFKDRAASDDLKDLKERQIFFFFFFETVPLGFFWRGGQRMSVVSRKFIRLYWISLGPKVINIFNSGFLSRRIAARSPSLTATT